MFSHYDRPRIGQLCEKAGLYVRALQVRWLQKVHSLIMEPKFSLFYNSLPPLQHYSELPDIKRVIVNTHAIEPQVYVVQCSWPLIVWIYKTCTDWLGLSQSLVEFFGTLSREWALECMKDLLLVNLRGNLQIIVQVPWLAHCMWMTFIIFEQTDLRIYRLPRNIQNSWELMHA